MIEIIPAIDIIDGHCVRLTQGDYSNATQYRGHPAEMAKRFADCGLRRLHLVDLDGAKASKPENLNTLESVANAVYDTMTIEWGGGVKTDESVRSCFDAGANCIVGGSIAVRQPAIFSSWLDKYGPEAIILGADGRDGKVAIAGWLEDTDVTFESIIDRYAGYGLTQAIVTDISRDGMLQGVDVNLYTALQSHFPGIDITVSGGISCVDDICRLNEANLRRVIVGKALYERRITIPELMKFINN